MLNFKLLSSLKKYLQQKARHSSDKFSYQDILFLLTTDLLQQMAKVMHYNSVYQDFLTDQGRLKSIKNLGKVEHNIELRKLLSGKTQVHPGHDSGYPDRATHTNNVRNLVREVLQSIGLNSPLGEAIALAHDIGHCAFGHAGERELDKLLADLLGGFDHKLAGAYIAKVILNYPNEVVEGIALHSGKPSQKITEVGKLTPEREVFWNNIDLNKNYKDFVKDKLNHASFLETALVSFIDEFEYIGTDIEAELKRGKVSAMLLPASFKKLASRQAGARNPVGNPANDVKAAFLDMVMSDIKKNLKRNLDAGRRVLELSPEVAQMIEDMKDFANHYIYMTAEQKEIDEACAMMMRVCFNFYKKYKYDDFKGLNSDMTQEAIKTLLIEDILYKDDKDLYELFLFITAPKTNRKSIADYLGKKISSYSPLEKLYLLSARKKTLAILNKNKLVF
jgi:dGTP triphosphohydrolase